MIKVTVVLRGSHGGELDTLVLHIKDWSEVAERLARYMDQAWELSPGDTITIDGE